MISRCPHCSSAFEIPEHALTVADGIVRCGSCMQLFNATQHALNNTDQSETDQPAAQDIELETENEPASEPPAHSKLDNTWIEENFDINTHTTAQSAPQEQNAISKEPVNEDTNNKTSANDIKVEPNQPAQQTNTQTQSNTEETNRFSIDQHQAPGSNQTQANDDSLAAIEAFETPVIHAFSEDHFENFEQAPSSSWFANIVFGIISLLLSSLCALQWLLALDKLPATSNPQLSNLHAAACQWLTCTNYQRSINKTDTDFESLDLLISSHPNNADALILKTTLINTSNSLRQYPGLALEFRNMNDQPLAARTFAPADYLNQKSFTQNTKGLPSNQPLQVELAFVDPGHDAVNYSLSFISAKHTPTKHIATGYTASE